jgi:hypothetical protein
MKNKLPLVTPTRARMLMAAWRTRVFRLLILNSAVVYILLFVIGGTAKASPPGTPDACHRRATQTTSLGRWFLTKKPK